MSVGPTPIPGIRVPREPLAALRPLLAVAVAVSVVHYVDNTVNFDDYPEPTSGPAPSQAVIGASWFVFTAFAVLAYVRLRAGRRAVAAAALAVYSVSGLVGLGHYTVDGATDMPWWRQTHIVADILCGLAVLAFAVWLARGRSGEGQRA